MTLIFPSHPTTKIEQNQNIFTKNPKYRPCFWHKSMARHLGWDSMQIVKQVAAAGVIQLQ